MERRGFLQALLSAGAALPIAKYTAIAGPAPIPLIGEVLIDPTDRIYVVFDKRREGHFYLAVEKWQEYNTKCKARYQIDVSHMTRFKVRARDLRKAGTLPEDASMLLDFTHQDKEYQCARAYELPFFVVTNAPGKSIRIPFMLSDSLGAGFAIGG